MGGTLQGMVTEIGGDLRRTGMDADIKLAIAACAEFYKTERLGKFNTQSFDFSTVNQQEYYTSTDSSSIPLIAVDDGFVILDTNNAVKIKLIKKPTEWIDQNALGSAYFTSPEYYALTRDKVRLFPIPSAPVQTIRFNGVLEVIDANQAVGSQRLSREVVATLPGSYASAWFTTGLAYEAMKAWAKGNLFLHKLRNTTDATSQFSAAGDYIAKLMDQGATIEGQDFVEASQF